SDIAVDDDEHVFAHAAQLQAAADVGGQRGQTLAAVIDGAVDAQTDDRLPTHAWFRPDIQIERDIALAAFRRIFAYDAAAQVLQVRRAVLCDGRDRFAESEAVTPVAQDS